MFKHFRHRSILTTATGVILAVISLVHATETPRFSPPFYAFQNGLRPLTANDGARLLKETGYSGVGSVYPEEVNNYQAACKAEGLRIYSIYTGGKVDETGYRIEDHVREAIESLQGTDALVELNLQRGNHPNEEQAIAMVREVADLAKKSGLKVVLYPHDKFYVERFDHAVKIAKASGRDNVGVTFNLCHFLKVQPTDDFKAALENAKPLLWSVSICGADTDGKDWATLIRPLDEGTFRQTSLLEHLRNIEFQGPIGLQCFNIRIDPRQHLARSFQAWQRHLATTRNGTEN